MEEIRLCSRAHSGVAGPIDERRGSLVRVTGQDLSGAIPIAFDQRKPIREAPGIQLSELDARSLGSNLDSPSLVVRVREMLF